jgi:hypothetical protein
MADYRIDFSTVPVIEVARELLGEESRERSTAAERHFPDNAGLFVNIQKNLWYSHGNATGGDAIELIKHVNGSDFLDAKDWLTDRGYIKPNGGPHIPAFLDQRPKHVREAEAAEAELEQEPAEPVPAAPDSRGGPEAVYEYAVNGTVLARKLRFPAPPPANKTFMWQRPDAISGWVNGGTKGLTLPPYRADALKDGIAAGKQIFWCEGEKSVDRLTELGLVATCFPNKGNAEKFRAEHGGYFAGADLIILPDEDAAGEKQAGVARAALDGTAKSIKVVRLAGLEEGRTSSTGLRPVP